MKQSVVITELWVKIDLVLTLSGLPKVHTKNGDNIFLLSGNAKSIFIIAAEN